MQRYKQEGFNRTSLPVHDVCDTCVLVCACTCECTFVHGQRKSACLIFHHKIEAESNHGLIKA